MKQLLALFISMSILFSCTNDEEVVKAGKYGMMGSDTPQYTAVLFMRAIYNEKTLDKAIALSSDRFARIIKSQYTNNTVQRQIFNLRLDTMETEPVSGGSLLFNEKLSKADIEMKIIGTYNGNKVTELKTLSMVRESGDWKVTAVNNTVP